MARQDSEQKNRILRAAIGVFAERGLRGATIRSLGRAAGVNSALLYYYYENKEALFIEAVTRVLERFLAHLAVHRRMFRNARARLKFLVDGIFNYYARHPDRVSLMWLAVSRHPNLFGRALERIIAGHPLIPLEVIVEGMRRGQLRPFHPLEAWWSVVGTCLFSLKVQAVLRHISPASIAKPSGSLRLRKAQILEFLLYGLARNGVSLRKKGRT